MLPITDEEKALWLGSSQKQLVLSFENGTQITNSGIYSESMKISQILSDSQEIKFGSVSSGCFKVRISTTTESFIGQQLIPTLSVSNYTRQLGVFNVESDKLTSDKKYRDIVAYDSLYKVINSDYIDWYNELTFPIQMSAFRRSFFNHIGIQQDTLKLVNDDMMIEKTIDAETLSGKDILESICEINGVFGTIDCFGTFKYISISSSKTEIFPSEELYPSNKLFPKGEYDFSANKGSYVQGSLVYEDYTIKKIKKLQIRQEENDIGVIVGEDGNEYVVQNNFLVYGKGTEELTEIAERLLSTINNVAFIPTSVKTIGMPWVQLGDVVKVFSDTRNITFPILSRNMSGISALRDVISADGSEEYSDGVNGISHDIQMLKGKSNVLSRTIEETKSEIKDVEKGLTGTITQTASELRSEYTKKINDVQSQIDNQVNNYSGDYVPTLTNEPAKNWTTTTEKDKNIGVIFYKITDNVVTNAYRFQFYQNKYQWIPIEDQQGAEALALAQANKGDLTALTNNLNKNYSTTVQMNSAINQSAESIKTEVSKTYATTSYVDDSTSNAVSSANQNTTNKLKSYSTTTQMNSAIQQSATSIETKVAITYETKTDSETKRKNLESSITQTAESIKLKVSKDSIIAEINASPEEIQISADKIKLKGQYVEFTDLSANGKTTINGANITTGTISADRLDVNGIFAKTITATGEINGGSFKGGYIECSNGKIGGWTVGSTTLSSYHTDKGELGDFVRVANGTNSNGDFLVVKKGDDYPFFVRANGRVHCSDLEVTGGTISGTTIEGSTFVSSGNNFEDVRVKVKYGEYISVISPSYIETIYGNARANINYSGFLVIDDDGKITRINSNIANFGGSVSCKLLSTDSLLVGTSTNAHGRKFLFIGDSYGDGILGATQGWSHLIINNWGLTNGVDVFNYTLGGTGFVTKYQNKNFLTRLDEFISDHPNVLSKITDIVVCGGYNDREVNSETILKNIESFSVKCKSKMPQAIIHVGHIGWCTEPSNSTSRKSAIANISINSLRAYKLCSKFENMRYMENSEYLVRGKKMFSSDGIHPNEWGFSVLTRGIENGINSGSCITYDTFIPSLKLKDSSVSFSGTFRIMDNISSVTVKHQDVQATLNKTCSANGGSGTYVELGTLTDDWIIYGGTDEENGCMYETSGAIYNNNTQKWYSCNSNLIFNNGKLYVSFAVIDPSGGGWVNGTWTTIILKDGMGTLSKLTI